MAIDDTIIDTPEGPMTWAQWKKKNPRADPVAANQGQETAQQGEEPHRRLIVANPDGAGERSVRSQGDARLPLARRAVQVYGQ